MTRKDQLGYIDALDKESVGILVSKGQDYAHEDVLSNFKRVSGAAKSLELNIYTPEGYALFMVLLKMDRINNLNTRSSTPNHESIEDSYIDGSNYFKLAYLCHKEDK